MIQWLQSKWQRAAVMGSIKTLQEASTYFENGGLQIEKHLTIRQGKNYTKKLSILFQNEWQMDLIYKYM